MVDQFHSASHWNTVRDDNTVSFLIRMWSTKHGSSSEHSSKVRETLDTTDCANKRFAMCVYSLLDKNLKALLCSSNLMPQSPTDVCEKCYGSASPFNNTCWLTWLECARHPEHRDEMGVTLVVGDNHEVVKVIELPKSLAGCQPQQLALCEQGRDCPGGYSCKKVHSTKELEYWKWTLIHRVLEKVHTGI